MSRDEYLLKPLKEYSFCGTIPLNCGDGGFWPHSLFHIGVQYVETTFFIDLVMALFYPMVILSIGFFKVSILQNSASTMQTKIQSPIISANCLGQFVVAKQSSRLGNSVERAETHRYRWKIIYLKWARICTRLNSPGHLKWSRICKRLRSLGIDSWAL